MPSRARQERPIQGITGLRIEGYKSLREQQTLTIRPLTIIAGTNSSGKSSAIQPLLLLKQTLEASHDPGPLQLYGPNVKVTSIDQVLSKGASESSRVKEFTIGLALNGASEFNLFTFTRSKAKADLHISSVSMPTYVPGEPRISKGRLSTYVSMREGMSDAEIRRSVLKGGAGELTSLFSSVASERKMSVKPQFSITRDRCFLSVSVDLNGIIIKDALMFGATSYQLDTQILRSVITSIIHLPAHRGNPQRTYATSAVERLYPGTFDDYTAGVIAAWKSRNRKDELSRLNLDLQELGLTWKVEATPIDDTQVELRVGRLPQARQGGAWDLVNIADVGFGVSQTLPVIVALIAALPGQMVYLEQPEIHLHPRAQFIFAKLLQRAVERGVRVVVETHSALLIRGIQTLVAREELVSSSVLLHWFTRDTETGNTSVATGELDDAGAFGGWPEDFDEVNLQAESAYLDAAMRKAPRE